MKIEFTKWTDEKQCLEAVKRNGDALQYVRDLNMLKTVAKKLEIEIEIV